MATISTKQVMKFRMEDDHNEYDVLVGPHPNSDETATVEISAPDAILTLLHGWMRLAGQWPLAKTKRVAAIPQGTKVILEIEKGLDPNRAHRVYLPDQPRPADSVKVTLSGSGTSQSLKDPGYHVSSSGPGSISTQQQTTGALKEFTDYVEGLA